MEGVNPEEGQSSWLELILDQSAAGRVAPSQNVVTPCALPGAIC